MDTKNPSHVTAHDLFKKYGVAHKLTLQLLESAGVKPITEFKFGRGQMRIYDRRTACLAVENHLEKKRLVEKAVSDAKRKLADGTAPGTTETTPPAPVVFDTSAITEAIELLSKQNACLLKAVEKAHDAVVSLSAKFDALQATVDAMDLVLDSVHAGAQAPATAPVQAAPLVSDAVGSEPARPKPVITIIGLFDSHKQHILRDFGKDIDLRLFNIDEAKSQSVISAMKAADKVVFMIKFINHKVEELAKIADVSPIRVTGGLSQLRDKLTELYVEHHNAEEPQGDQS